MIFVAFGLLLGFNAFFVVYNVVVNIQDKRRKEAHEKRRKEWEAEQNDETKTRE